MGGWSGPHHFDVVLGRHLGQALLGEGRHVGLRDHDGAPHALVAHTLRERLDRLHAHLVLLREEHEDLRAGRQSRRPLSVQSFAVPLYSPIKQMVVQSDSRLTCPTSPCTTSLLPDLSDLQLGRLMHFVIGQHATLRCMVVPLAGLQHCLSNFLTKQVAPCTELPCAIVAHLLCWVVLLGRQYCEVVLPGVI